MKNQLDIRLLSRRFRFYISLIAIFSLILVLLLLSRPMSQAQAEHLLFLTNGSGWRQSNISGFGNTSNTDINALEVYNGLLYAGAANSNQGATIWRTRNGNTWTLSSSPGFSNTYTSANAVLFDLIEFNGQLYAGTGDWFNVDGIGGQIWRSTGGASWTPIEVNGFGETSNNAISTFGILGNALYAATGGNVNGLQIWRSNTGDAGSWTRVITNGNGDANNRWVTGFNVFNGYLYAAIETTLTSSVQIWRTSDGTAWTQVNISGFGDANNYQTGGMTIFNGYIYVGTRNDVTGPEIWRSANGTAWNQVVGNGFDDSNNYKIESLIAVDSLLYAVTDNSITGAEVWRSTDGTAWTQDALDGFGSSANEFTLWSNASAVFNNTLFIGTTNKSTGGQVWQKLPKIYLPLIIR